MIKLVTLEAYVQQIHGWLLKFYHNDIFSQNTLSVFSSEENRHACLIQLKEQKIIKDNDSGSAILVLIVKVYVVIISISIELKYQLH